MKTKLFLAIMLVSAFATLSKAQTQGTIIYEQRINLHKNLDKKQKGYKKLIPEFSEKKYIFLYDENSGRLFEKKEKKSGISITMSGASNNSWIDFINKKIREYIEVDGEMYYTEEELTTYEATKTGETKKILNYTCFEYKDSEENMTFWVCPDLPSYITPMPPICFEGAVLEICNDDISYVALSISNEIDIEELSAPAGTEVTREQAEDLRDELFD